MNRQKKKFIEFVLKKKVLQFGQFQLKSGRISPYFFNSQFLYSGYDIFRLSQFYAYRIMYSKIHFDRLFGLAYKGIPLVSSTAITLQIIYNLNIKYAFNRKEHKLYSDSGIIVGKELIKKKIIIIDDVITAGLTIQENIKNLHQKNIISGIFVAFDRQEKGILKKNSTHQEIHQKHNCKIFSIINVMDLIQYLKEKNIKKEELKNLLVYYEKYGSKKIPI